MDLRGKRNGKWIQGKRENVSGSKGKGKRCVDPRGKEKRFVDSRGNVKGERIQGELEKACGFKGKE